MTKVKTRSTKTVMGVKGIMRQRVCSDDDLASPERSVKVFKKRSVETFDKNREAFLYTLLYCLLDDIGTMYKYLKKYVVWTATQTNILMDTRSRHIKELWK